MTKKYDKDLGVYLHIPFCLKKCSYCAFNSFPKPYVHEGYIDAMIKELQWGARLHGVTGRFLQSLYFGGGTPSLLEAAQVEKLLTAIGASFSVTKDSEITLEVNPAAKDGEKLKAFRAAGINRLSIGVQSFSEKNLKFLGRLHNGEESRAAFADARRAGFDNISIDLIFALPGQNKEALMSDLEIAAALGPEHLSLYLLTMEEGTPMSESARKGKFTPADDCTQETLFLLATDYLSGRGYQRYETSNYARPGYHSRHNMRYWQGDDYIGLGAGAHSYLSEPGWGMRWWNPNDIKAYEDPVKAGFMPLESLELLGREEAVREMLLTALRTKEGLNDTLVRRRFGLSLKEVVSMENLKYLPRDLYRVDGNTFRLTDKGALLTDEIAMRLSL